MAVHAWTPEEIALLRARYPNEPTVDVAMALGLRLKQVSSMAYNLRLEKTEDFRQQEKERRRQRCLANPDMGGHGFKPGNIPWHKGKSSGVVAWNKGTRGVMHNANKQPIGTEVVSSMGYLMRKVSEADAVSWRNWQPVHHLNWLAAGREIPPGYVLVFKDGDRLNTRLENLELISRAENLMRNSYHNR